MFALLVIDQRRHVSCMSRQQVPAPFVCPRFRDVESARHYLRGFRDDVWFVRAVQQEMRIVTGGVPAGSGHPGGLIDQAAVALLRGQLQVAVLLPDAVEIVFDAARGSATPDFDGVGFASRAAVGGFLARQLLDEANAAAFSAALAHPASARDSGAGASGPARDSDQAGQTGRLEAALWQRYLVLQPDRLSQVRFRLLWADRSAPVAVIPNAAAAVEQVQPRRPILASARRAAAGLPEPPDSVSPQAQTLIDAAQDGTPFCEECARQAAEMADA